MKIGIVGLKAPQVKDLRGRRLNFEIMFFDSDTKITAETVETFAKDLDRLVVMYPAVPKAAVSRIPANKIHGMSGSLTTIMRYFDSLSIALKLETQENPSYGPAPQSSGRTIHPRASFEEQVQKVAEDMSSKSSPAEPMPQGQERTPAPPVHSLFAMVPRGRESGYVKPEIIPTVSIETINENGYSFLDGAKVGDMFRLERPAGTSIAAWKMRIAAMRSFRGRKKGQTIEAHFFYSFVDVRVMADDGTSQSPVKTVMPKKSEEPPISVHKPMVFGGDVEKKFWRDVYVAAVGRCNNPAEEAERAVAAYQARFK